MEYVNEEIKNYTVKHEQCLHQQERAEMQRIPDNTSVSKTTQKNEISWSSDINI